MSKIKRNIFPNIIDLCIVMLKCSKRIVLLLPKNSNIRELIDIFCFITKKYKLKNNTLIVEEITNGK